MDESVPNLPREALEQFTDAELVAYVEMLEDKAREAARRSFPLFARKTEVPGVPDKSKIKASDWRRVLAEERGLEVEDDDPDEAIDWYPDRLAPAAHHDLIMETVQGCIEETLRTPDGDVVDGVMVFLPPGSGKALCLETPIPTPTGWKRMGDLRVGDQVFDEHGKPCNVTWVSPIHRDRPVYEVVTDCGDRIVADKDHEWLVRLCGKPRRKLLSNGKGAPARSDRNDPLSQHKIKETWELAKKRAKRPMIMRAAALDLPRANLPIDPYTLGVWLGDGTSSGGGLTLNDDDAESIVQRIRSIGYEVRKNATYLRWHVNGIRGSLVDLDLLRDTARGINGSKHIPPAYLRASYDQRLALLQGLVDTDGTVCKKRGCTTFSSTSKQLALGFRELVRSLGVKAGWSEAPAMLDGKHCGTSYKILFYHSQAAYTPRKAQNCRDQYRTPNTYIDVTLLGERRDTVCIEVDSESHLFLCGRSMTPTHNSTYTSMLAPAYFMGRFPNFNVIGVSYAQSLADRFSRRAREICSRDSYRELMGTGLAAGSTGVQNWSLDNGSEYRAAGIQAAVTGFRADLLAWDDPVAGAEEADSEVIQNKTFEAWQTDLSTRLKPGGKQLGIMTRWNMGDLAGRILSDEKSDEKWNGQSGHWKGTDGRNWYIICLPMIAENDDDPLGRKPGELLWPEHFRARDVEKIRARAEREGGSRAWSALYQQRPSVSGGNIVKRTWWQQWTKRDEYGPIPPECSAVYLFYDTAFEAKETADYSAMTAWGIFERVVRTPGGREFNHHQAVLLTSWQERVDAVELPKIIKKHTERFERGGTSVEIFVEGRASGKQIIQELRRMRLPVREWLPKGPKGALGKVPRTHAATFPFESGCIWYIPSAETLQVIDQVSDFPNAPHDDLHDTVTMAMDIFRRRFLVQMPTDELDDDEYEEDILRRRAEKKRLENRRLYG
jgi:phage terminase large subunit-like protein